jgi:hypothetical protein
MNKFLGMAAAVAFAGLASAAQATTVYDNGAPNGANGNETAAWVQAEDFKLGAAASLTGATVDIFSYGGASVIGTPLHYDIFGDLGGSPGAILASGAAGGVTYANSGVSFNGHTIYDVAFNFATPFSAAANTTYWLGIHETSAFNRVELYFATTNGNGTATGHESYQGTFDNWGSNGQEHAFSLQAGVPEPATWALMLGGFGLAGVALRRRQLAPVAA